MPLPTPEQIAAAQAAIKRQPPSARIVPAPYDVIDERGQVILRGTSVWRYVSGRQYGGPSDMSLAAAKGEKPVEYSYLSLDAAKRRGWTEAHEHNQTQDGEAWSRGRCVFPAECNDFQTRVAD